MHIQALGKLLHMVSMCTLVCPVYCSLPIQTCMFQCVPKPRMLAHTYPHKPLRKESETMNYAITRLTAYLMCGLMSNLVICKFWKKHGHTWHRMSLLRPGVIKQRKPKPIHYQGRQWRTECGYRYQTLHSELAHYYIVLMFAGSLVRWFITSNMVGLEE